MPPKSTRGFSHRISPYCPHCVFTVPWTIGSRPWDDFECSIRFQRGVPLKIIRLTVGDIINLQAKHKNLTGGTQLCIQVVRIRVTDDGRRAVATMAIVA